MPIYEYYCSDCSKDISILFLSYSEATESSPTCPDCGNKKLERLLSKVSITHNKKEKKAINKPTKNSDLENPRSLADTMKKASRSSKADYGDDFKEVTGRLEKGESPVSIEKKLRKRVGETMETH
ncbi:MAG: zinc ribbon domain-containing protein [Thermodesulfobacteriota bacterium]